MTNNPGTSTVATATAINTRRRADIQNKRPTPTKIFYFLLPCALIIGLFAGALFMRQRYRVREVFASVNGTLITKDELYRSLERVAGAVAARKLVSDELTIQFARQKGLPPTDADVDVAYNRLKSRPNFEQQAKALGLDESMMRRELRVELAQNGLLQRGITVSDQDVQAYYKANIDKKNPKALFYSPETIQIAVITTKKIYEAQKAISELRSGRSFNVAAKDYSTDPSALSGGLMPPVQRGRSMTARFPDFEKQVFAIKIGETSQPINFDKKWWVIRCLDKKAEEIVPFAKVAEECRQSALLKKGIPANAKALAKEFSEFQKKANVKAFQSQYQEILKVK